MESRFSKSGGGKGCGNREWTLRRYSQAENHEKSTKRFAPVVGKKTKLEIPAESFRGLITKKSDCALRVFPSARPVCFYSRGLCVSTHAESVFPSMARRAVRPQSGRMQSPTPLLQFLNVDDHEGFRRLLASLLLETP
jgi:hypothetical protein